MYTYDITNRKDVVREIKKYLYLVSESLYDNTIPRTTIDGFYDEETTAAVTAFQKIKGINPSGAVDYETFTLLFNDYKNLIFDIEYKDYILENNSFPFKIGDFSDDIRIIHLIINELSESYVNIPKVRTDKYYSVETENAVSLLRDLFFMDEGKAVDKELYYRMKKEIEARRHSDEIY